jgi:hypothetical protein
MGYCSALTDDVTWLASSEGLTLLRPFASAPYPHASRAQGHTYQGKRFDADTHYADSTVGLVIPAGFRPTQSTDFIVHFHGWGNHVSNVIEHHALRKQLAASGRNAILVVPQGPKDASDSGCGKLEEAGGFERLVRDVAQFLKTDGKIPTERIGKLTLSAHSGGYSVTRAILERGGLARNITDVLLFDASYGGLETFADWGAQKNHRLISLFTAHLASENFQLLTLLQQRGAKVASLLEPGLDEKTLSQRHPTIIHTLDLPHDEVLMKRSYFETFVRTTQ